MLKDLTDKLKRTNITKPKKHTIILQHIEEYLSTNNTMFNVVDISKKFELNEHNTLKRFQILETGNYILKRTEMPGRPEYDGYVLTEKGENE